VPTGHPARRISHTDKGRPGADLLEFLKATNEGAADESRYVHA
jgi:hypothetical protein